MIECRNDEITDGFNPRQYTGVPKEGRNIEFAEPPRFDTPFGLSSFHLRARIAFPLN